MPWPVLFAPYVCKPHGLAALCAPCMQCDARKAGAEVSRRLLCRQVSQRAWLKPLAAWSLQGCAPCGLP